MDIPVSYTHLTYVETDYDFKTGELKVVREKAFSDGERAAVKCYGANDVLEGVAIKMCIRDR